MNYGMMISASGALTSMYRQQVLTNNLANVNTAGFKSDIPMVRQRDVVRVEDSLMSLPSNAMLERLGAGVMLMPTRVSMAQGTLKVTGRPFDLALQGRGFFAVSQRGEDGQEQIRLTRDGRFARNAQGRLVQAATGLEVLDERDRPIDVPGRGSFTVNDEGWVFAGSERIARLQITDVPDLSVLKKLGANLFAVPQAALNARTTAPATVRQNHIEQSTVNEISALMAVTSASRAVSSNIGMITYHDRMMDRAINSLGRVA